MNYEIEIIKNNLSKVSSVIQNRVGEQKIVISNITLKLNEDNCNYYEARIDFNKTEHDFFVIAKGFSDKVQLFDDYEHLIEEIIK